MDTARRGRTFVRHLISSKHQLCFLFHCQVVPVECSSDRAYQLIARAFIRGWIQLHALGSEGFTKLCLSSSLGRKVPVAYEHKCPVFARGLPTGIPDQCLRDWTKHITSVIYQPELENTLEMQRVSYLTCLSVGLCRLRVGGTIVILL